MVDLKKKENNIVMAVTIRNITKDTTMNFDNDHTIHLPMRESLLKHFLGRGEWIIVDSPVGNEFTDIFDLNKLAQHFEKEDFEILSRTFLFEELMELETYSIINFTEETAQYNTGNGVYADDWWKGYVLHNLGYEVFPFTYTDDMEDYVKFEQLWYTAFSEGWREISYNGNLYLVKGWE